MLKNLWAKTDGVDINLDAKKATNVGREAKTGITDTKCSRIQVQVAFDENKSTANVTQKGGQNSSINGKTIGKGKTAKMAVGDKLEVLAGKLEYEFRLSDSSDSSSEQTSASSASSSKRKRTIAEHFGVDGPPKKVAATSWKNIDQGELYIYETSGIDHRSKIAGFDIDGTIIVTKSGRTFATNENDWQIIFTQVGPKLKELHKDGYKIVFFTNQNGIAKGHVKLDAFQRKVQDICDKLAVPIQVFVSPGTTKFRKPFVGMWERLEKHENGGVEIDRKKCVYVGDAAGRPMVKGATKKDDKKKDFSCGDRLFALNLGISFKTPEEFFLEKKTEAFNMPEFDPKSVFQNSDLLSPKNAKTKPDKPEMIVMVGGPGSGKSSFVQNKLLPNGYVHVNRDTLKTWQKCVEAAQKALKAGDSVVIDNTNPDLESRKRYIEVAQKSKVPCRCFVMNVSQAQAEHNNKYRLLMGTDKEHKDVNRMVMNMFKSKYKEPKKEEGYDEVVKVNFIPEFKKEVAKRVYQMYLVEK